MMRWNIRKLWPFVLRSTHDRMARENFNLRGAIRSANEELARHRTLIAALKSGQPEITRAFEKAIRL